MKNYKSIICVAAVCLLGTAAFCGFRIYHYYAEVDEQTEAFEEIAEMVEQAPTDETVPDDAPVSEGEDVLAKYQELYLQSLNKSSCLKKPVFMRVSAISISLLITN